MKLIILLSLIVTGAVAATRALAAESVRIENVLLTVIDQVELPAKESGALADLLVREGNIVEKGRQVASIEDDEARMALTKAERELAIARAKAENDVSIRFAKKTYEVAQAEHRRARESIEKFQKSVSETELDQLRLNTEKAQLEIEQAEHERTIAQLIARQKEGELESAQIKMDRHRLIAPFTGMAVQINKLRGEWVNPGDIVLRLVRLDRLRVEAFVAARDFDARLEGRRITILVEGPAGQSVHDATVKFVSPEVNPVNGQVRLWAEVDNRALELRPGQSATLVIPPDALAGTVNPAQRTD